MTITSIRAKELIEQLPKVTPVLSKLGPRKGEHIKYAYRYSYGHAPAVRHISIIREGTNSGITVYVNRESVNGINFPEHEFLNDITVDKFYAKGYEGKNERPGLSTAAAGLSTLNPAEHEVLRLSITSHEGFARVLDWYFDQPAQRDGNITDAVGAMTPQAERSQVSAEQCSRLDTEIVRAPAGIREALVKVRYGQGAYRDVLIKLNGPRCWMSGIEGEPFLIASHIKPWSHCEDDPEARGDPDNGLLLSSLWDAAFDAGLVTFGNDWRVIPSEDLSGSAATALARRSEPAIPERFRTPGRMAYLTYHRETIFERWKRESTGEGSIALQ